MKVPACISILLVATCIPTLLAQTTSSGPAQSGAELLNQWVLKERNLAVKGHADAQEILGESYYSGIGVPQDYAQAARWLRKAAEQNDPGAQYMLGGLYLSGEGVPQDYHQAYFWLDLAAAQRSSLVQVPPNAPQAARSFFQSLGQKVMSDVANQRDEAASHLTRAELSRVQQYAEKWIASHAR